MADRQHVNPAQRLFMGMAVLPRSSALSYKFRASVLDFAFTVRARPSITAA